eukprot:419580-Karenia_brevis.AAC.1
MTIGQSKTLGATTWDLKNWFKRRSIQLSEGPPGEPHIFSPSQPAAKTVPVKTEHISRDEGENAA